MNFEQFDEQIRRVADIISLDGFQPDALIGIARGGWIPARLLSKYLGVKPLHSFGLTYADSSRTEWVTYQDVAMAEGQKILVVEDYLESGKSIKHVVETLAAQGHEVRSAAIGYLSETIFVPTYSLGSVGEIPDLPWD